MKMRLQRQPSGLTCTIGELFVNDQPFCHTLEDLVRVGPKIAGETAIPPGFYLVELTVSGAAMKGHLWTPNRDFKLPQLMSVPGFDGVRIHAGNTDRDTQGCVLVGDWNGGEFLGNARKSLIALMDLIDIEILMKRPISIEIVAAES